MTHPILMPWPEFMLPYKIITNGPDLNALARFKMRAGDLVNRVADDYYLRYGTYCFDEFVHKIHFDKHGPLRVVTNVRHEIIGFTRRHYTWVDPAHYGKGLSAEMIASVFLATGREKWMDSVYVRQKKPEPFNKAGYAAQKKAYKLLVERGFIDPGNREDIFAGDWGRV